MHLVEIKVTGFRNLKSVCVQLGPGLNVLVGANNVGKTNILEALRIALGPAAASDGSYVQVGRDDFIRTASKDGPAGPIRIDLTFSGLTTAQLAHFHELIEPNLKDITKSIATIHFEAIWDEKRGRATFQRWGGSARKERAQVSMETLQALPTTFLPALRDAEAALTPGYRSRVAHLFRDRIERLGDEAAETHKTKMVGIYEQANQNLLQLPVVGEVKSELTTRVKSMSGTDYVEPTINAAPPAFHRILRSLCVALFSGPVSDVGSIGLGYNNLLYVGTVLTHLSHAVEGDLPLLVVEEPEAHLHPQLVQLLAEQLELGSANVQTLVSTHSPALASSIDPRLIRPMFRGADGQIRVGSIASIGLDDDEAGQLERMMDMTRASLLFAKAAILVEGISEALLIPALAKRLDLDLRSRHVAVIPIVGVAFGVFAKLLGSEGLQVPVAIITDSDPPLVMNKGEKKLAWDEVVPEVDGAGVPKPSARTAKLISTFANHSSVRVYTSSITLEHDLAAAGSANPGAMVDVWAKLFVTTPRTLNKSLLEAAGAELSAQALVVWRGICLSSTSGSKAEFAHALSKDLESGGHPDFEVPEYIIDALQYVTGGT